MCDDIFGCDIIAIGHYVVHLPGQMKISHKLERVKPMPYVAKESDVQGTVNDFIVLCDYVEAMKPAPTKKGDLPPKACFEINQSLSNPKKGAKPTDRMYHHLSVPLWFTIALESGMIIQEDAKGSKTIFTTTDSYNSFKKMNVYSQYLTIFQAWYCLVDIGVEYERRGFQAVLEHIFDQLFYELVENGCDKWFQNEDAKPGAITHEGKATAYMMAYGYSAAHVLMNLGLIEYQENGEDFIRYNYLTLSKVKPTPLGYCIMKACETRRYALFNTYRRSSGSFDLFGIISSIRDKSTEQPEEPKNIDYADFLVPFLDSFPKDSVHDNEIFKLLHGNENGKTDDCTYELKVSLGKKCYRIIHCSPEHTFEDLHIAIQNAFSFDNDHLYSFFLDGKKWSTKSVNAEHTEDPPYTYELCLGDVRLKHRQKILYIFDFGDQWAFDIVVSIIEKAGDPLKEPVIIESVGKSPAQYPDYYDESEE